MITLKDITLRRGEKLLFDHANAAVFAKQKTGIIGLNGSGKSSLFALLLQKISLDGGELYIQSNLEIAHLSQEIPNSEISALQYVMNGDLGTTKLLQQIKVAEEKHDGYLVAKLHNHLYEIGGYTLESRAAKLLIGLGFKINEQQKAVNTFSGGWRMRLNLAQVLISRADLLLFDEPTNHLDLEMREALTYALQEYTGALVLVAHDRYLLKATVNEFYLVSDHKVAKFQGDLDDYQRWLLKTKTGDQKALAFKKNKIKNVSFIVRSQKSSKVNLKKIGSLEAEIKKLHSEKEQIALVLSTPAMYQQENKDKLTGYLKQSSILEKKIKDLEEKWFELQDLV